MAKKRPRSGKDGAGHHYVNFEDWTRLTYIPAKDRPAAKNWANQDVIAVRAYKDDVTDQVHMGAEIPIGRNAEKVEALLDALRDLIDGACKGKK